MTLSATDILNNNAQNSLSRSVGSGMNDICYEGTVLFRQYRKIVLPLDRFIFWLATPQTMTITGSLHIETHNRHTETERYDYSDMVLTTQEEVQTFHQKPTDTLWMACIDGTHFSIDGQKKHFKQAGLFHYFGSNVPPSFRSQFIHTEAELDDYHPVISSSLPIFLALPHIGSPALGWCPWPKDVPIFPSFSSPDNQEPPYIIIHNDPHSAQPVGLGTVDPTTGASTQIMTEKVKLTLIGLPHQKASNIRDYIRHWALLHPDTLGITNIPVIVDEKSTLDEISALSMMKHIEFDVMYIQNTARDCAFKLIEHAKMTLKSNTRTVPSS